MDSSSMLTTHPVPEGCDPNEGKFVNSSLRRGLLTAAISGGVVLLGQGVAHADDHGHGNTGDDGKSQSTKSDNDQKQTDRKDDGDEDGPEHRQVGGKDIANLGDPKSGWPKGHPKGDPRS